MADVFRHLNPESQMTTRWVGLLLYWLVAGLWIARLSRERRRRIVGEPLVRVEGDGRPTAWLYGGLIAAALIALFAPAAPERLTICMALLLAAGVVFHLPQPGVATIGRTGVHSGWQAFAWADLQAWRLGGEHLRVLSPVGWLAVPVHGRELSQLDGFLRRNWPEREDRRGSGNEPEVPATIGDEP